MAGTLKTAEKILQVLEMYSLEKSEWGLTELSDSLNLSKSVVYRILNTLENENYLHKNSKTKKYKLGRKLIKLGEVARKQFNFIEMVEKDLQKLADKSQETVLMDIPDNNNKVYVIKKIESYKNIKYTCNIGDEVPLYVGAYGKAILANMSQIKIEEVINNGLSKFTDNTITNPKVLRNELERIKKEGYAVSIGEWNPGGLSIASPIFGVDGKVMASVGVSGPEFRMNNKTKYLKKICINTANKISRKI